MLLDINYDFVNAFVGALGFILALLGVILGQYIAFKTKISNLSTRLETLESNEQNINSKFQELYLKMEKKEDLHSHRFTEIYKSMRKIELHLAKTTKYEDN